MLSYAALMRSGLSTGMIASVRSRAAMNSGLGVIGPKGASSLFDTALKTRNAFERGIGVMLEFDPCMTLQSKITTVPAGPVGISMPDDARSARLASSGTPYSCFFNDCL